MYGDVATRSDKGHPSPRPNPTQTFRQSDNVSTIRQRFRHSDNGSDIPTFRQVDERSTTDKVCPSKQRARQTPDKRPTTPDIRCSDNARHVPTIPDKCPTIRQSVRHSDNSDKQGSVFDVLGQPHAATEHTVGRPLEAAPTDLLPSMPRPKASVTASRINGGKASNKGVAKSKVQGPGSDVARRQARR